MPIDGGGQMDVLMALASSQRMMPSLSASWRVLPSKTLLLSTASIHRFASGSSVSAAALNKFTALTTLQLEHNLLRVLAPLELPLLRSLQLHHNRLARLEAAWLRGVPRLQLLDVSYNRLASLEGIEVLPLLAELRAASNCLRGASALAPLARGCTGLHTAQLKNNGRPAATTNLLQPHAYSLCPWTRT